jgi:hypothetical protein
MVTYVEGHHLNVDEEGRGPDEVRMFLDLR